MFKRIRTVMVESEQWVASALVLLWGGYRKSGCVPSPREPQFTPPSGSQFETHERNVWIRFVVLPIGCRFSFDSFGHSKIQIQAFEKSGNAVPKRITVYRVMVSLQKGALLPHLLRSVYKQAKIVCSHLQWHSSQFTRSSKISLRSLAYSATHVDQWFLYCNGTWIR